MGTKKKLKKKTVKKKREKKIAQNFDGKLTT